jgi:ABC-2 type transport system permease protein
VLFGALLLLGINVVLAIACYLLLRSGWKIRA